MFKIIFSFILLTLVFSGETYADDFVPEGEEDVTFSANVLTLDGDDTGGDINLQFGNTLGESLQWDSANARFSLSDSLDLQSRELINIRVENLASAPTCDAGKLGQLYYNTTDKLTYSCDGMGVWNPLENALNNTIEFPVVQARRTTSFTLTTTYTDVALDVTDLENDATTLDHDDVLRDRIDIGADAMYQIIYGYTAGGTATGTHEARARVRVNDTTVLTGSESVNRNYQGEFSTTSASFLAYLTAGDFISLQLFRNNVVDATQDEIFFSIVKLEGIKGDKGDPGDPGGSGDNTDSNTFTLDNDNTGGDVRLVFGATLSESLTWDSANSEFDLSDDLNVSGDLLQAGNTFTLDADNTAAGANVSIVAEQGTDNNGEIRYNATDNVWEVSNDGGAFIALEPGTASDQIFYAYDAAGNTAIGLTPVDIPFDTEIREDAQFMHAADSAEVTINTAGNYSVDYNCTAEVTTDDRSLITHYMMINTGSGFTETPGTRTVSYHRTVGDGRDNANISHYQNFSAGDMLKFQAFGDSNGNLQTVPDSCRLKIIRLDNGGGLIGPQGPQGPAGADGVSGGGWSEDGVTTSSTLNAQIDGDLQVNGNINSDCGASAAFWAERGGVASNQSWSMGNGQTPWGSVMGCSGTVQRFAATCTGSVGTSLGAEIRVNDVSSACDLSIPATIGGVANTSCNVAFGANDVVGVYAQTESGSWTECMGTFWVKYD
ncbi:hypothetical protein GW756_02545 [bacterium]|nr:hypothetical protein [bacterium]NCQ55904.1 hypothetical protein [Candidatus Parcubacteria bacterium]NCS67612.1 hypothetical protein [Candidatus Peregrinibacteria bacterium]NCS96223.1 hypothetical protein [bacterium]